MDREAWRAVIHGVAKNRTWLSDWSELPPGPSSHDYGFSSGHVWMWELDYKEGWVTKNWCFWTVVLEKTLESSLDCDEIQPVHPKGDQFWVFIGRTDVKTKTPILWPPDAKSCLIWKVPDARKDLGQEEKGMTEDERAGWHHRLDGHEFGWTPGVGDGQGGLACCDSWGRKECTWLSDWTELNMLQLTFLPRIYTIFTNILMRHVSHHWKIREYEDTMSQMPSMRWHKRPTYLKQTIVERYSFPSSTFWDIRKEKPHLFSSGLLKIPSIPLKNSKAIWNSWETTIWKQFLSRQL